MRYENLGECSSGFQTEMKRRQFRLAMEAHGAAGSREESETSGYSLRVEIRHCIRCGKQWASLIAKQRVNKSWRVLSGIRYSAYCTERVDALEQLAGAD
jgi:hypothetical protein